MKYLQPWITEIAHFNVADQFDMDLFANEVFTLYSMTGGEDDSQVKVLAEHYPVIIEMRDKIITPAVMEFSKHSFNYEMDEFYVETNGKWIPPGEGLFPHLHPGSVISAICYPSDSENALNMFDPRCNAARGYPKPMRNHHFANLRISPKKGDIYIFPSYINHSVSHVTEDIRLSLLHEYYVTKLL
jgi:hypothetical protein